MDASRREFLVKLARSAAYAAPVIVSMSAPDPLLAQAAVSHKKGGNAMGMGKGMGLVAEFEAGPLGPVAPWSAEPPGG